MPQKQMPQKQNIFDDVNIGWGNSLLSSGNKQLPEPMLTHIYVSMHKTINDSTK